VAFDPTAYEQEVIKPLRRYPGKLPEGDLAQRYAVWPGITRPELEAHLRKVRAYWNQNSSGAGARAQVCKLLQAADDELQRREGAAMLEPAWWEERRRRHDQQTRDAVQRLANDLRQWGSKNINEAQLAGITQHFPTLTKAQIDEAVRLAGLQVVAAVELPTSSGLDRVAYTELNKRLGEVGVGTIVQLLHPDLSRPFRLVRAFEVPGDPRPQLDRAVLERRRADADQMADSSGARARKAALGILHTGLGAGADLRTIALYQVVEQVRIARASNLADVLLIGAATRLGLEQTDAELLVLSLPSGGEASASPATHIKELLEEGRLRAAQQALAALSDSDDEAAAVRALVEANSARVEQLVRSATAAESSGREEEARRLLLEAHNLAQDDPDLEGRLQRLPLAAPHDPTAVEAGVAVQLGWKAPSSAGGRVRYRVVRTEGRPAASPQDGAVVAETTELSCSDARPPVARRLQYTVFATTDGRVWSRPAAAKMVLVLPPAGDVAVRADPDRVTATWKVHPDAYAVRVRRTEVRPPTGPGDGVPVAASRTTFADTAVREGTTYHYALVTVYRDEQGRDVEGRSVLVSATPQSAAAAVLGLTAETISVANDIARIRLRWPRSAGSAVRIRYSNRPPQWTEGAVVPVDQIEHYGTEAAGDQGGPGAQGILEADVPLGYHVFVPFALGGTGAVVGRAVGLGVIDSVRQLEIRRTGTRATLSWVWPPEVNLAEVEWSEPTEAPVVRRITRGQYTSGGGLTLTVGPQGAVASVRAIVVGSLGEAVSPPAVATVEAQALRLSYRVARPSRLASLRSAQPWKMRITVDNDCSGVDLSLVVARGLVVPLRPDQGIVVQRFTDLTLAAGVPLELEVPPPHGISRPYWIKCFVTRPASVMVTDPPINEMKVA
jgi:hypothetical protein